MIALAITAAYLVISIVILVGSIGIFYSMSVDEETATASFQLEPESFKRDFKLLGITSVSMIAAFLMVIMSYFLNSPLLDTLAEAVGGLYMIAIGYVFSKWVRKFR